MDVTADFSEPSGSGSGGVLGLVKRHQLAAFFVITFAYSYLAGLPLILGIFGLFPWRLSAVPAGIIQLSSAWGPTLTALFLTAVVSGKAGLRELLGRLLRWRVGAQWYAFMLLAWGAFTLLALGIHVFLGGTLPGNIHLTPWYGLIVNFVSLFPLYLLLGGPLAEELGWRGYALPRLLASHSALFSGLLVGMIWSLWHLPLFWIPNTGSGQGLGDFAWFFVQLTAVSMLFTWVYINTGGSVLLCVLGHAAFNVTTSYVLPLLPEEAKQGRPFALFDGVLWLAVLLVVAVAGPARLSRLTKPARTESVARQQELVVQ